MEAWRSEGMPGLPSGAPRWVSEDGGWALLQVAHWAQGIPGGGEQVRLGGQLLGEEIPAGRGTCSLLKKGEWVKVGRTNSNPSSHLFSGPRPGLVPRCNSKAS